MQRIKSPLGKNEKLAQLSKLLTGDEGAYLEEEEPRGRARARGPAALPARRARGITAHDVFHS